MPPSGIQDPQAVQHTPSPPDSPIFHRLLPRPPSHFPAWSSLECSGSLVSPAGIQPFLKGLLDSPPLPAFSDPLLASPLGPGCSVHPGLFFHGQQPVGTTTLTQRTLPSPRRREEPGVRGETVSTCSRGSHTAPSSSVLFKRSQDDWGVVCTSSSASGEVALGKRG